MKRYLKRHKLLFALNLVFIFLNESITLFVAFLMQYITDSAVNNSEGELLNALYFTILWVTGVFITGVIRRKLRIKFIKLVSLDLKFDYMRGLLSEDIVTYVRQGQAKHISSFNNNIKLIEEDYFLNIFAIFSSVCLFVIATSMLLFVSPLLAIISIVFSCLPIFIPQLFSKRLKLTQEEYYKQLETFNGKVKDILNAFEVVKAFRAETNVLSNHSLVNHTTEEKRYKFASVSADAELLTVILSLVVQFSVLMSAGFLVLNSNITVGTMIASVQLCGMTVDPIRSAVQLFLKLKATSPIGNELLTIVDKIDCSLNCNDKKEKQIIYHNISLNSVSYSYSSEKVPAQNVLNEIDFKFSSGKKYVIVGNSGSGKSTIAKLILGYYPPTKGSVTIDGKQVIDDSDTDYNIAYIQQENIIFDDTFENNLTLYKPYSKVAIMNVVKIVGFESLGIVTEEDFSKKIDSNTISGGEKQRIAIARAILIGSNILIADEVTSNLDNKTSFEIEKKIFELKEMTIIWITHRLNKVLLQQYDEVLVLKDGRLVEHGTFDKLISNKSYFYNLYSISL
ncbi:MAG: ABC transporter ATP-binding protein/permease [Clostridium sp.]|jgi:ATP-binding cassette subfamily C protein|nr:ABC transporter ATP-binding protein/permease [Clostridium sp.]